MGCFCEGNKKYKDLVAMRSLAKMAAKLEHSVFVLFEREDGTYGFVKEGELFSGKLTEYIFF